MKRLIAAVALVASLAVAAPAMAVPPPGTDVEGYKRCIRSLVASGQSRENAVRICQGIFYK